MGTTAGPPGSGQRHRTRGSKLHHGVTVTVGEVRLSKPVAETVIVYVPLVVGIPTLAESERISFWWSVTLAGVITTIPAGEPATAKLTVMSALAKSQKPQPGGYAYTAG